jgi:hypothetical protein
MTTKFMSATLLAAAAVFGLASGTAFAGNDRVRDAGVGYVYPNFWGEPSAQQRSSARTPHQADGASIGAYFTHTHQSTGTYLFPPNPWQ